MAAEISPGSSPEPTPHQAGLNPDFNLGDSLREAAAITDEQLAHHAIFAAQRLIDSGEVSYRERTQAEWNAMVQEVQDLRQENAELFYKATHDKLTGLLNLEGLALELDSLMNQPDFDPSKLRFLFVDGTNMKAINDNINHDAGDEAIKGTAAVLMRSIRKGDIVARIGGDEFVVLFTEPADQPEAEKLPEGRPNLRESQSVPAKLSPIQQRIADESRLYLQQVPEFVAQGFDIAVGAAEWQGDFQKTKALAEANMAIQKGVQHQLHGQYRPPVGQSA